MATITAIESDLEPTFWDPDNSMTGCQFENTKIWGSIGAVRESPRMQFVGRDIGVYQDLFEDVSTLGGIFSVTPRPNMPAAAVRGIGSHKIEYADRWGQSIHFQNLRGLCAWDDSIQLQDLKWRSEVLGVFVIVPADYPATPFTISKGRTEGSVHYALPSNSGQVRKLFQRVEDQLASKTEVTAQYAVKLIQRIKALSSEVNPSNISGRFLASVDSEDGSTTIEWIRDRSRLGFVLDSQNESSWFIVLPSGISRSGYLYDELQPASLRALIEEFVNTAE
jgi:hypothetical protein